MKKIGIVMGSDSDLPIVRKAAEVCASFGVPFELRVLSAHRSSAETAAFAKAARDNGFGVLIGAAGMAAHLAGALAANTDLPVIALPVKAKALEGVDALLSSVMMPPGVPVACVGIDCAANAGYLAVQILAVGDEALAAKYADFREAQHQKNLAADEKLQSAAEEIRNGVH
ncbi:MAG: 5-(carboxyamino)imidazole ribonucleotide mutase [Bacteroides sp.]|nr:5-(carboxyamino)imidazole ribonucleotide mutase [Eubacterium sp.]MCM1418452.1 5-(carboxyamino)imidazole ribonucleotide mutase [Roseburia sp.]MCM1462048.1 5-(carboxyamino)imidazole ribonucleotide mutase [Bacteroides sp.]